MAITSFNLTNKLIYPSNRAIIARALSNQLSQPNFAYVLTIKQGTNVLITYKVFPNATGEMLVNVSRFCRNIVVAENLKYQTILHPLVKIDFFVQEFYGTNPTLHGTPVNIGFLDIFKANVSSDYDLDNYLGKDYLFFKKRSLYKNFSNFIPASKATGVIINLKHGSTSLYSFSNGDNESVLIDESYDYDNADIELQSNNFPHQIINLKVHKFTCEDKPVNCIFLNSKGFYENFCFSHYTSYSVEDSKLTYTQRQWQYDNSIDELYTNKAGEQVVKAGSVKKFRATSHYVYADEYNYYMEEIIRSEKVYLEFELGKYIPVIVENKGFQSLSDDFEDLIKLQLDFRLAYDFED